MINRIGKATLLFGNKETGGHIEGTVIIDGIPGNCFWELIPIPQNTEKNQEPDRDSNKPYRRSGAIGFRGR